MVQSQILGKKISIQVSDQPIFTVLQEISTKGQFDFSYNASIIDGDQRVSIDVQNEPVQDILRRMIPDQQIQFKERKGVLIIYKIKLRQEVIMVSHKLKGIVTDVNGNPLDSVRIVDVHAQLETWSTDAGAFEFIIPNPEYRLRLDFEKEGYFNKKREVYLNKDLGISVILEAIPEDEEVIQVTQRSIVNEEPIFASVEDKGVAGLMIGGSIDTEVRTGDSLYTKFASVGLFPVASTKGVKWGEKITPGKELNRFAFHVLADYGAGIDGFAFSGLTSVYKYNVKGVEIAGLGNYTGGNTKGIQIAGLFNSNTLYTSGAQVAGITNVNMLDLYGAQVAGLVNVNRDQLYGVQVAGIGNYTLNRVNGMQISSIMNKTRDLQGVQVTAIYNRARYAKGLQVGLINSSNRTDGIQLGLINIADSLPYGLPVGLINVVRNGYSNIEVAYDDQRFGDLSVRSGVKHFYTGFKVGFGIDYANPTYRLGLTAGTEWKLIGPLNFNLDLDAYHVTENPWTSELSFLSRVKSGFSIGPKGLDFFGTINYSIYTTTYLNEEGTAPAIPLMGETTFNEISNGTARLEGWGYSFGLRISLK